MQQERKKYYESIYGDADFVNRGTTKLEDFVINDQINGYDLYKLAELNGSRVEFSDGWKNLVLDLFRELDAVGWNRRVTMMKEKWGGLQFAFRRNLDKKLANEKKLFEIVEKYERKSLETCHLCGKPGKLRDDSHYWQVSVSYTHLTLPTILRV